MAEDDTATVQYLKELIKKGMKKEKQYIAEREKYVLKYREAVTKINGYPMQIYALEAQIDNLNHWMSMLIKDNLKLSKQNKELIDHANTKNTQRKN